MKKIANEIIYNGQHHLSLRSAARMSGYHRDYLGQMIRTGELPAIRAGRSYYIEHEKLIELIQSKKRAPKHKVPAHSRQHINGQTQQHNALQQISFARLPQYAVLAAVIAFFVFIVPFIVPLFARMDFMVPKLSLARAAVQKELGDILQTATQDIDRTITILAKHADEQWETIAHKTDKLLRTGRTVSMIALGAADQQRERTTHQLIEMMNDLSLLSADVSRYFYEPITVSRNSFTSLPTSFRGATEEAGRHLNSTTGALSSAGRLVLHIPATAISAFRQTRENISDLATMSTMGEWSKQIGVSMRDGVINATAVVADKFIGRKAVLDAPEMKDSITGDVYCVRISNGEWNKFKGTCGEINIANVSIDAVVQINVSEEETPTPAASSTIIRDTAGTTTIETMTAITSPDTAP